MVYDDIQVLNQIPAMLEWILLGRQLLLFCFSGPPSIGGPATSVLRQPKPVRAAILYP